MALLAALCWAGSWVTLLAGARPQSSWHRKGQDVAYAIMGKARFGYSVPLIDLEIEPHLLGCDCPRSPLKILVRTTGRWQSAAVAVSLGMIAPQWMGELLPYEWIAIAIAVL